MGPVLGCGSRGLLVAGRRARLGQHLLRISRATRSAAYRPSSVWCGYRTTSSVRVGALFRCIVTEEKEGNKNSSVKATDNE